MKNNAAARSGSPIEKSKAFLNRLNMRTVRLSKKLAAKLGADVLSYVLLVSLSGIFLAPFLYLLGGSFMSAQDLADVNVRWVPTRFITDNYRYAFSVLNYIPRFLYSFGIAAASVAGQVLSCSLVGYGLSRFRMKLRGLLFAFVIFSLIVPPQTVIVSQFIMFSRWNMVNSWLPVVLPCFFSLGLNGGLFVFIFRQFFSGLPKELEDAAMLDRLGFLGTFARIILPSSSSALLVTSILSLIWQWNNFFEPMVYIRTKEKYSLTMMMKSQIYYDAVGGGISYTTGITLAASVLIVVPLIILFFLLQKRFIRGIESAGLAN